MGGDGGDGSDGSEGGVGGGEGASGVGGTPGDSGVGGGEGASGVGGGAPGGDGSDGSGVPGGGEPGAAASASDAGSDSGGLGDTGEGESDSGLGIGIGLSAMAAQADAQDAMDAVASNLGFSFADLGLQDAPNLGLTPNEQVAQDFGILGLPTTAQMAEQEAFSFMNNPDNFAIPNFSLPPSPPPSPAEMGLEGKEGKAPTGPTDAEVAEALSLNPVALAPQVTNVPTTQVAMAEEFDIPVPETKVAEVPVTQTPVTELPEVNVSLPPATNIGVVSTTPGPANTSNPGLSPGPAGVPGTATGFGTPSVPGSTVGISGYGTGVVGGTDAYGNPETSPVFGNTNAAGVAPGLAPGFAGPVGTSPNVAQVAIAKTPQEIQKEIVTKELAKAMTPDIQVSQVSKNVMAPPPVNVQQEHEQFPKSLEEQLQEILKGIDTTLGTTPNVAQNAPTLGTNPALPSALTAPPAQAEVAPKTDLPVQLQVPETKTVVTVPITPTEPKQAEPKETKEQEVVPLPKERPDIPVEIAKEKEVPVERELPKVVDLPVTKDTLTELNAIPKGEITAWGSKNYGTPAVATAPAGTLGSGLAGFSAGSNLNNFGSRPIDFITDEQMQQWGAASVAPPTGAIGSRAA